MSRELRHWFHAGVDVTSAAMPPILVTDGDQRSALAITRSLGGAGYRVIVCSTRTGSLAGASRYAAERVVIPDPLHDPDAFFDAVEGAARRHKADVLIPVSEASLLSILPRRDSLLPCVVPFASAKSFVDIC